MVEFAHESPQLTFFMFWIAVWGVVSIVRYIGFKLPNRAFRSMNIRKHGWPPEHCDADGDFRPVNSSPKTDGETP